MIRFGKTKQLLFNDEARGDRPNAGSRIGLQRKMAFATLLLQAKSSTVNRS